MPSKSDLPRRIGVFSDIHGNLHALQAVLHALDQMDLDEVICLGDVVGYGAFPNECIQLLQERGIPSLAGNHDHAAIGMTDITYFNDIAKRAVHWTRDALTEENAQWLRDLPYTHKIEPDLYFVHASPRDPEAWNYVLTYGEARQSFEYFTEKIGFIGHSHQPAAIQLRGENLTCPGDREIEIQPDSRYLINVGSVGQPRDRNPQAGFVSIDLDENLIRFIRVAYDIQAAQNGIHEADLPAELAERIGHGW